ncbi:hypothetical protein GCM10029964_113970 [Kibdelosporangium lantanae]
MFSLGSTLYAAVEGEPPFGLSENTLGLLHAVAAGKINPPRYAGPLAPVLISLLATEAEDRPTAAQARDMLAAVARGDVPDIYNEGRTLFATGLGPGTDPRTRAINPQSPRSRTGVRPAVAGGSRTGVRPAAGGGSRTGVRPAAAPPPNPSRRPFVIGGVALVAILGIGGYLIANAGGHKDDPPGPSNVNSSQTTSAPNPPPVEYSTPSQETTTSSSKSSQKPPPKTSSEPSKTTSSTSSESSSSSSSKSSSSKSSTPSTPSTSGSAPSGG